ncbi:hypothetical protein B0T14DRAFT_568427 [Immersiella caudata]|uniref:Uncharacterized protein n=1 Tax=Immersiella caudata TaxID=314043 RepID=A0AA39WK52_9PEZI|nr:hypothetical protein B0T14DRAFT_568427 [Immersiella caudata]
MPGRQTRKRDPFQRIHSWDDGYDYSSNTTPSPGSRNNNTPYFSTPPTGGANRSYYEPDRELPRRSKSQRNPQPEPYNPRRAYPSPPSDYSDSPRDRDRRRPRSPPPYRDRETRSPSPPRRRDRDRDHRPRRPSLETYPTAPPRPNNRPPRSPSPLRHRDRDSRREAPAPTRSGRYRSPSPPRKTPRPSAGDAPRPGLSRSKTTGAAAAAFAKERFNNLNPQWKAAAMAAIQAGGMAALQARKQPGGWNGQKGAKIATAALGAAAMGALKKDKDEGSGGRKGDGKRSSGGGGGGKKSGGVEAIGGALGGFLADQFAKREGKRR